MRGIKQERAVLLGEYLVATEGTVRSVARHFGLSKSTAHKDISCALAELDRSLYERAEAVLMKNKRERHLRGGLATREKYRALRLEREQNARKDRESACPTAENRKISG